MNMIDINLVPLSLRKKKKSQLLGGFRIPLEVIIGSVSALFLMLIMVHIGLLFLNIKVDTKLSTLKTKWEKDILPFKKNVDAVVKELRALQSQEMALGEVIQKDKIFWSKKLNILSDNIPRGVWIKKIIISNQIFTIEGSAISKTKNEMIGVHSFAANLKKDIDFMNDFEEFELGAIQSRKLNRTEVADFLIRIKLKNGKN